LRQLLPAGWLCVLLAAGTPASQGSEVPVAGAGAAIIPSEMCRGLWVVPVAFGEGPEQSLRLILDTGAGPTSVDPDSIARVFGRQAKPGKKLRLKNGHAGPLKIRRMTVVVHEMDGLSRTLGTEIDGILGFPVFEDLLLTLDYHDMQVRVAEGELPAVDNESVFRDVGKVRPYLAIDLGETRVPVLIDSGSTSGLTLLAEDPIAWETRPRATSGSMRYRSIEVDREGRASSSIAFGPLSLSRPIIEVREEGTRLAGYELMRRFAWTFDQSRRRIRIVPDSPAPITSEPVRGIGLVFQPRAEGFAVAAALDGMPAAAAGVRKGDIVTAVNGTPLNGRGCRPLYDQSTAESVVLSLLRGEETLDIAIEIGILVP
jgi:hypothetical protein